MSNDKIRKRLNEWLETMEISTQPFNPDVSYTRLPTPCHPNAPVEIADALRSSWPTFIRLLDLPATNPQDPQSCTPSIPITRPLDAIRPMTMDNFSPPKDATDNEPSVEYRETEDGRSERDVPQGPSPMTWVNEDNGVYSIEEGAEVPKEVWDKLKTDIPSPAVSHIPLAKASSDISVDVGPHPSGEYGRKQATVKDELRKRAWTGEGKSESEAATEAFRKFLGDRNAPEYVKK